MKRTGIDLLRAHAIAQTLFPPTTLKAAIKRLGFVQADPIRSPRPRNPGLRSCVVVR